MDINVRIYHSCIRTLSTVALALLSLGSRARAQQILGCDAVSCPVNQYGTQYCPIGNITVNAIGVANFSTSLSPDPFTWTTTISSSSVPTNSSVIAYERGYILGLPPGVDLSSVTGCTLFFDEISPKLKFSGNDIDTDTGSCEDAMGRSCIAALRAQTKSIMSNLSSSSVTDSSTCADLEFALRNNPPRSCSFLQGSSWGSIHVRELEGPNFPDTLNSSSCHPTIGFNYSLRLLDTYDIVSIPISTTIEPFAGGVTPILTILLGQSLRVDTEEQTNIELDISCLKPVAGQTGPQVVVSGASTLHSAWSRIHIMGMILGAMVHWIVLC